MLSPGFTGELFLFSYLFFKDTGLIFSFISKDQFRRTQPTFPSDPTHRPTP